ncbi:hypothetical protein QYF61_006140 [Mycteria americana]|uniref:Uncharacterized protein n=1 Tax=Mycteria americana TaxID=33587 RepID=A0AAN7NJS8_MYCAM|nr:hypothetical protein QYF61_006140 [Mycteria americana]
MCAVATPWYPPGVPRPALGSPAQERPMNLLERVQRRTMKMLGLFSLEKRRLRGDLIVAFQYVKGAYKKDGDRLFTKACSDRTRGKGFKLKEGRFRLDMRKTFITIRVVTHWHRCPEKLWMSHHQKSSRPVKGQTYDYLIGISTVHGKEDSGKEEENKQLGNREIS